jgi:serine phosphatase RsbU (regulator of sigma subunit)/putative methionine-R-sulfoxide reductase with GAF domain
LMREHGRVAEFESQVYRRDGSIIWISENARAVHDEVSGELLYYEGLVQDITRRKRAEEARRQAEARKDAQYAVTRTLAEARHLREAAGKILRAICESVGWDFGDLWYVDAEAGVLRSVDMWHLPELDVAEFAEATRAITFALGVGLPGRVWASGQAAWITDVVADANFPRAACAAKDGLHAAFAFPIPLGGEIIGVMEFFSRCVREPDDDLLSMLVALGSQIGQFIERNRIADQLARYADELRARNAQLEADLDMARDIQQVFLTQTYPSFPPGVAPEESWLRFCHCYRPAQSVGGDFFCVLPLSANEAGVFICDVIGHGLRAALVTAIVRGLVEELTPVATDPGRFMTQINRSLRAIFRQIETPMLASAFYLVVNIDNGKMAYANAGHPPPFHVRRGAGVVETLGFDEGHGPVLGIFEEAEYCTGYCATAAEDLVMLFTDGLFEVEIANGEYYGQERLLATVRDRMRLPAGELFAEVLAEVQERCVWREFEDDVCLVGMEVTRTGLADASRRVA